MAKIYKYGIRTNAITPSYSNTLYINSVADSYISTRAARQWSGLTSGSTYTIKLNGDWATINGNGWDIFGYSFLSAGNTVSQTTESNIVYDSITDTTTLDVTLSGNSGLVFAHPNSDVTDAEDVLNSINPQIMLASWS